MACVSFREFPRKARKEPLFPTGRASYPPTSRLKSYNFSSLISCNEKSNQLFPLRRKLRHPEVILAFVQASTTFIHIYSFCKTLKGNLWLPCISILSRQLGGGGVLPRDVYSTDDSIQFNFNLSNFTKLLICLSLLSYQSVMLIGSSSEFSGFAQGLYLAKGLSRSVQCSRIQQTP